MGNIYYWWCYYISCRCRNVFLPENPSVINTNKLCEWVTVMMCVMSIPIICLGTKQADLNNTIVWFGCGEKYRERQKRSDCTLDTVSCQNAYFAACPLHSHLTYSAVTKSTIQQILPWCNTFLHFSWNLHSTAAWVPTCWFTVLLFTVMVIKPSSGRVLIHSHLWIELKLNRTHLVVTGGMCR